ncbi:hypothetical protein DL98DRAFT_542586 [Cadophora sp. DSE1049]|nr:hypothetical protein DL98DRAFT_542586 [Cadophora sp. DSE1049]
MEAGGGATRLTRRANPFTALAGQAGQTDDSDGDSENDLTEGDVTFQAAPGAPKSKRFTAIRTPKRKTDTIIVASEEEDFSSRPLRRTRKSSAKAKQNKADHDVFGKRRLAGKIKQDAHNKKMEAKLAHMEKELEAVKGECQAVKEELHKTKQEMADGITALMPGNCSPNPSYAEVARTLQTSQPSNAQTLSSAQTSSSSFTNTLYCTIDTSRVEAEISNQVSAGAIRTMVEKGMRNEQDNAT